MELYQGFMVKSAVGTAVYRTECNNGNHQCLFSDFLYTIYFCSKNLLPISDILLWHFWHLKLLVFLSKFNLQHKFFQRFHSADNICHYWSSHFENYGILFRFTANTIWVKLLYFSIIESCYHTFYPYTSFQNIVCQGRQLLLSV